MRDGRCTELVACPRRLTARHGRSWKILFERRKRLLASAADISADLSADNSADVSADIDFKYLRGAYLRGPR
ncbi:MAG: hypothetical protein JWO62_1014 [Acidimicrobiaceae bacterium]|nr:hypothetical protein [Acidimicrobiaceae bacterium]